MPGRTNRHRTAGARRVVLALSAGLLALSAALGVAEPAASGDGAPAAAVPAYRQANRIAILEIHGPVDLVTLRSLERRIKAAAADGADAIVLDLDTPGGRLDATLDICNLLKDTSATPPNTVAWIHPQAYSAGTIIALACREIVVAPNATFGDAAPIQGIPAIGLMQMADTERAKVEAPILAEMVDSARRNHYDENLVQAFVSVGVELWLIENVDSGERVFVNRHEYETVFGEAPPDQMTPVAPPKPAGPAVPAVAPWVSSLVPQPEPDQGPAMTTEQIRQQIEYQQQLPAARAPLTAADAGKWRPVGQVITRDRLLTVKRAEALHYGLAQTTVANEQQLLAFFGAQSLVRYRLSWSEWLVRILVSLPVRIVLIIVFLVGLFAELSAPGLGAFGATAAVALLLLVGAPLLAGMAQWWDILLIVIGILLLGAEIFLIPGFGLAGGLGALCLLAGLIGTFVSGDVSSPQGREELWTGIVSTFTALFASAIGMWLVSKHFGSVPLFRRLVLEAEVGRRVEAAPASGPVGAAAHPIAIGDIGVAATDLRPSGRGSFGGRLVDVQSVGRYIDRDTPIRVISVGRYVIEVEEAESWR